jgi:hypothetical protein
VQAAHQENAHEHTGSAEAVRPSLRNGFTAYFGLSPVTGLFATVVSVMRSITANLTPASGRQDHTTSPYATIAVRPAHKARATTSRPPHPIPRKMTIMIRPSFGTGRSHKKLICLQRQVYF